MVAGADLPLGCESQSGGWETETSLGTELGGARKGSVVPEKIPSLT